MAYYSNLNKTINTRKNSFSNKKNIGTFLIVLGIVGLFVMIFKFPFFLKYFISGVIGLFSYAVFLACIVVGIFIRKDKSLNLLPKKYVITISIGFFALLCILHLACSVGIDYSSFGAYLSSVYKSQLSVGGVLLGIFVFLLKTCFTITGAYIVLSIVLVAMIALIVDYYFGFSGTKSYVKPKITLDYQQVPLPNPPEDEYLPNLEEPKEQVNIGLKANNKPKVDEAPKTARNFNSYSSNKTMDTFIKNFMPESMDTRQADKPEMTVSTDISTRPPIFVHNDEFGNVDNTSSAWGSMNSPFSKTESKESLTNREKNKRFLDATINRRYQDTAEETKPAIEPVKIQNAEESIRDLPMNSYVSASKNNDSTGYNNFRLNSVNKHEEDVNYNTAFIAKSNSFKTSEETSKTLNQVDGKEIFNRFEKNNSVKLENEVPVNLTDLPLSSRSSFKPLEVKQPEKPLTSSIVSKEATMMNALSKTENKEPEKKEKPYKRPPKYRPPTIDLLNLPQQSNQVDKATLDTKAKAIEDILASFKVPAKVCEITTGPQVTRFELTMPPGISVNKINALANDITAAVASRTTVRVEAPIPGKNAVGVEVPNDKPLMVSFREVLDSKEFWNSKSNTAFALGKEVDGNLMICELNKMPHLLVGGTTGSGKSVCLNSIILSILYKSSPEDVRIILIDPKAVEFTCYNGLPHLLMPKVITNPEKAVNSLAWLCTEMDRRYQQFSAYGFRKIEEYNQLSDIVEHKKAKMPYIVVIIDEFADLMSVGNKDLEMNVQRLTQKARACGIHVVIATQRPSSDVITGTIKSNLPSAIALKVNNNVNSRIILDEGGAENLLGHGDMIYAPMTMSRKVRVQGCYISDDEVRKVVDYVKENNTNYYDEEVEESIENFGKENKNTGSSMDSTGGGADEDADNDLMKKCLKFVIETQIASGSMLQRNFRLGYNRAARIVDQMQKLGYISAPDGAKKRQVLITMDEYKQIFGLDDDES